MKPRYALAALATMLAAGTASAQYTPATYQEPYCREFTKVVNVGGQAQNAYGQACRQPDGSWQIVSDDIPSSQPVQYYPQDNYVAYQPPVQPVQYYEPTYYQAPTMFSLSFNSWNPNRTRYYNNHGHGWRDHDRDRGNGNWGRGNNGRSNGNGRHDSNGPGRGNGRH